MATGFKTCRFTSERCPINTFIVLTPKFPKFFSFRSVSFFKNYENLVFGTQLVPITSELNLIGFTFYTSSVTM